MMANSRYFIYVSVVAALFCTQLVQPCSAKIKRILWNHDCIDQLASDPAKASNLAYKRIMAYANRFCGESPVSVVNKPFLPEGCTKNDYVSLSTYAWPDSAKADGLPYVLKDGYNNPEAEKFNRPVLSSMVERVQMLTLAWKLTGEVRYAEKAVGQIQAWFIDEDTRMTPHLNYGQIVLGANGNRGNDYGVLDGFQLVGVLDPLILLEDYDGFAVSDRKVVKDWFADFLSWLATSVLGQQEALAQNNHGTAYDCQVLAFSIYTGNAKMAKDVIKAFPALRVSLQIEPDGTQPRELKRPRSFIYSVMNLDLMMDFLIMAKFYGFPVKVSKLERYFKAWEFLMPYLGEGMKNWPFVQVIDTEYAQWQACRDMYIVSKYLVSKHLKLKGLDLPNDDRTRKSIYSVVY